MNKQHTQPRPIPQTWNAPTKEQKFIDKWERIRTETRAMPQNEINRNGSTNKNRNLQPI